MNNQEYQKELAAVRGRADRLHADLEKAMDTNKQAASNTKLADYRLNKLEDGMIETRREMVKLHTEHESRIRNLENFVTRAGAAGVPMRTILLITTVVGTLVGAILAVVLK